MSHAAVPVNALGDLLGDRDSTDTSDSSWAPPGEMTFTLNESKPTASPIVARAANGLPSPNRTEIARGQIHEAY